MTDGSSPESFLDVFFFTSVLLGINKMKGEEMRGERAAGLSASHSDSDTFVKSF